MRTLAQWLALQESVHPKTIDMGLERVSSVARTLRVERPESTVITVAGTNGKGSTVAHLEALLRAAGASTGMFTSPHLVRYNERIRVDGAEVHTPELIDAFERIEAARGATTLTFFEYNTLAALVIFAQRRVEVLILEVGLGGRLDATNLVDADAAVVCSIGLDHCDWLGSTLEQIGAEKAAISRPGRPVVLSTPEMPASVFATIERIGARPVIAGRDYTWQIAEEVGRVASGAQGGVRWTYRSARRELGGLPPSGLAGSIQYRNAAAAIATLEALRLRYPLDAATVSEGLRKVRLAGRFQVAHLAIQPRSPGSRPRHVPPGPSAPEFTATVAHPATWILDIAHNEPAARVFARHLAEWPVQAGARTFAIVGILTDKDAPGISRALEPCIDQWILCALPGPRGGSAQDLAQRLQLRRDAVTLASSVEEGCEIASAAVRPGDRVIVFGSVHTVGPAMQWLRLYSEA